MKKIITGILATLSCLALLSGCSFLPGFNNSSTPTESSSSTTTTTGVTLAQAKSFIRELYKDQNVTTSEDYTLITKYAPNANDVFTITWTVDVPETSIKIVPVEGKDQVTVDLDNEANEDVSYTLKGVIANKDGEELEVEFYRTLKAVAQKVPYRITEAPKENVPYKYYVFNPQGKDHHDCYVNGEIPNASYPWYLGTSENFEDGVDFYAEYVEGTDTFHLKTTIEGKTQYLNIVTSGTHTNTRYEDVKGPYPFKFNTDPNYKTITADVNGTTFYMGIDGTYTTLEAQKDIRDGYCIGYLCELIDRNDLPDAEKVDTESKALLSLQEAYVGTYELELPATGSSFSTVAIKWTVEGEGAKIENGKLKLTAGTAITEFTLKAEIKLNEAVKAVEMKAKLVPNTETAILEAGAALSKSGSFGNEVELTGVITRDADIWTSDSGSNSNATFRIAVGGRTLGAYRINGSQAVLFEDLVAGAKVTIKGFLAKYNGTLQFAQGSVATKIEKGGVYNEPYTTAEQIFNAATALADGETLDSYTLEGVVSNIASPYDAENGNMNLTINVGDLAFYCYRLTGSACSIVKVGDTITVTGNIMKYYDNVQFGSGCKITAHKPGEVKPEEPVEGVLASIDMMGTTNLTSRTDDKTVYTANGITYTNDKATSTNPNYNQTGTYAARAYQGSTITITYGTAFKAVVFTLDDYSPEAGKDYMSGFDGMTITGATIDRNNDVVIINFETAVTTFTTANLLKQIRIEKIELYAENVTATPGEGETPDTPVVPDTPTTEGPTAITSKPVENTAYKFYMYSTAKNTGFYFTGAMSGYYGATSEKAEEGVDLYVEYATGSDANFYIYFTDANNAKQYINVVSTGSHVNFTFGTTASTLFTWNETISSFVTVSEFEKDGEKSLYYLGTYNDFTTIGTCKITYTDNYVVKFVTMGEGSTETPDTPVVPDTPTTEGPIAITSKPVENTAYKFYMVNTNKNVGLYFTGAMSGYYGATSEKAEEGVDLYVEYAEGSDANFYIYFNKDSVKQYINVVSTGSHVNFTFGTTASTLFTWNETISSFVTVSEFEKDGEKSLYYLGTYNDFTTIGTCKISYTDNYVVKFVTMGEGSTETPDTPVVPDTPTTEGPIAITSKPVENTAYKFYMVNTNKNVGLYFTGAMSGYYGATSEKAEEGVDLYVEYATGSDANFYIYFNKDSVKQYINVVSTGSHVNFTFGTTASTLFTWNETISSFVTVSEFEKDGEKSLYYLGTYNDFTTIGTCKITYTDNYVVKFVTMGEGSTETPDTPVVPEQPETPDTPAEDTNTKVEYAMAASNGTVDSTAKTITWTAEGFTIVASGIDPTNTNVTGKTDHYRAYKNTTVTITAPEGKKIAKIVIKATTSDYAPENPVEGFDLTKDGTTLTYTTETPANSFVLNTSVAQVRISSITIYYV